MTVTSTPSRTEVGRAREAGRPEPDHGDPAARRSRRRATADRVARVGGPTVVADEPLEPADGHRLDLAADDALALALGFLRAHTSAHRRQHVGLADHRERAVDVLHQQVADEARDVDRHRASGDARGARTLQASLGLAQRLGHRVAERHLVERVRARDRIALGHRHLGRLDLAQLLVGAATVDEQLLLDLAPVVVVGVRRDARRGRSGAGAPRARRSRRWWASKSGPSTHANRVWPSTVTRHEPHMPVPSTMIVLSDTTVCTPRDE
jgi:hypothetical protein